MEVSADRWEIRADPERVWPAQPLVAAAEMDREAWSSRGSPRMGNSGKSGTTLRQRRLENVIRQLGLV